MMDKKGRGHIEVIISFILFVGFVSFILILFNPLKSPQSYSVVDSVFNNMEDNLSIEMNRVSLRLSNTEFDPLLYPSGFECFEIGSSRLANDLKCEGEHILVMDRNEEVVAAGIFNGRLRIDFSESANKRFYTINCVKEVLSTPTSCSNPYTYDNNDADIQYDYELGIITQKTGWSNSSINELVSEYNLDYNNVKPFFIRDTSDFGFTLWTIDDQKIVEATNNIPTSLDVIAKTIPIDIINSDGEVIKHKITIFVW